MKSAIEVAFMIGDRVRIKALGDVGTVYAITKSRDGLEYQVKWFSNADRKVEWLVEDELEAAP